MTRTEPRSAAATAYAAAVWASELLALVLALVLSLVGDYAPVAGRHLGRWAGRTVRALRSEPVRSAVLAADYAARRFVTEQLGSGYPALTLAATPAACLTLDPDAAPEVAAAAPRELLARGTRRELLEQAKAIGLRGYSRMSTDALAAALA